MPSNILFRSLRITARAVPLFLLLALAGCSDQAPEPKATAQDAAPANATAAAEAANATAAAEEGNATAALVPVLAGNATLLVPGLPPEAGNATLAACAPPPPEEKAPARPGPTQARKEKPAAKPAKATASAAPAKAKAKVLSGPLTLERAQQEFTSFARLWVAALSRNMLGNAANMAVTQEGGGYVARFAEVEQDSMELEVKPTDSPACPFVGVLKYFECSYEARGDSPEAAKSGEFSRVRKVRVTELFRHSGARWE